jgi:hypothetical protein
MQKYNFAFGSIWVCQTVREEHRLKVFENKMLRRMFGPEVEENSIVRNSTIVLFAKYS